MSIDIRRVLLVVLTISVLVIPHTTLSSPQRKLVVVATIPPLAAIAKEVGGQYVEVHYLVPPGSDPHQYALTPDDLSLIETCDVFVSVGREGFLGMIPENAGRVRLGWDDWIAAGVYVRDGNPHYLWLYPPNAIKIAQVLYQVYASLDPSHADYYESRLRTFESKVEALQRWASKLVVTYGVEGAKIALVGRHFEPLAEWLGLRVVAVLLETEGATASPGELAAFEDIVRKQGAQVLITQRLADEGRLGETVARDVGIPVVYLYGVPLDPSDTYTEFIKYDVALLVSSLAAGSPASAARGMNPAVVWTAFALLSALAIFEAYLIRRGRLP